MDYKLSQLIAKLYQHTSLVNESNFQRWALEEANIILPFDSCQWSEGYLNRSGQPVIEKVYFYKTITENFQMLHWDLGVVDPFLLAVIPYPHKALCYQNIVNLMGDKWKEKLSPSMIERYENEHLLATFIPPCHDGNLFSIISFSRNDKDKPFCKEERKVKEVLSCNLVRSHRLCLRTNLFEGSISREHNSVGLINSSGKIIEQMETFTDFLNKIATSPIRENTIQDREILQCIKEEYEGHIHGTRFISRMLTNRLFMVVLHRNPLTYKLSAREIEAVRLFKQGKQYKKIAEIMGVEESTVRTTLKNARGKVGGVEKTIQIDL